MDVAMRVEVYDPDELVLKERLHYSNVLPIDEFCERPTDVLCNVNAGDFPGLMDEVMGGVKPTASHFIDLDQVIELRCGLDSTDLESDDYDSMSAALEEAEGILRENREVLIAITLE